MLRYQDQSIRNKTGLTNQFKKLVFKVKDSEIQFANQNQHALPPRQVRFINFASSKTGL